MCSPRPHRQENLSFEDHSPDEALPNTPTRAAKPTTCKCSCMCGSEDPNNQMDNSPVRGRSLTPKHDRTNSAYNAIEARPAPGGIDPAFYNATSSVDGQEGLSMHQVERSAPTAGDDGDVHANNSIERWLWLDQHHIPEHLYRSSSSADVSMLVEASTAAPSSASSGFLPPRTATSDELTTFTYGGFDEPGVRPAVSSTQTCAFTPLWLTHELRYCRNFPRGNPEGGTSYPATIDVDDFLE